jgi:hypothetical protein
MHVSGWLGVVRVRRRRSAIAVRNNETRGEVLVGGLLLEDDLLSVQVKRYERAISSSGEHICVAAG